MENKETEIKIKEAEEKELAEIKGEKKIAEANEKKVEGKAKSEESKEEKKLEEKGEKKAEEKKEEERKETAKLTKKTEAVVRGADLAISKKHSMAICDFIRGKNPEKMIQELEKVIKLKKAIKMKGEIPHRKGMMSGRYPVNASKVFINLLKSLIANANMNGLENVYIATAKADDASRPFKRGGSQRFKRTNVLLIAKEKKENK